MKREVSRKAEARLSDIKQLVFDQAAKLRTSGCGKSERHVEVMQQTSPREI
jgi:hypothetical protein